MTNSGSELLQAEDSQVQTAFDRAMSVLVAIAENTRFAEDVRVDAAKAVLEAHHL
jgi:hypothetical protein